MALLTDNEVQLRISARAEGGAGVEALTVSVDDLQKELDAVAESAQKSGAAQAEAANNLAAAKATMDDVKLSLMSAKNEYKFLADRAKEAGAGQAIFAEQATAAKQRIADLKTDLAVASGNVRTLAKEQRSAATDSRIFTAAQERLADQLARTVRESKAAAIAAYEEGEAREQAARDAEAASRRAIESQRQSAIAAQKAAEYTQFWETELQKVDNAQASAARQAAQLDGALRKLGQGGASSANMIRAEILDVNKALLTLARSTKITGSEFDRAFAEGQRRIAELEAKLRGAADGSDMLAQKTGLVTSSIKQLAIAYGGIELARKFIEANVGIESLDRSLTQILGSSEKAAAEIEWLRNTTNRLGIDTQSAAKAYTSLAASAKGTSLEGEGTRRIFEAVAGSMAKLGKSSADTEGALQAVSQMMGKGTVSMEEMRQQLAERLPGAMQATADALGITVGELTEMIGTGSVLAEDLLPKLAQGLEKMYGTSGQAEGTVSAWNRLKNAIAETFQFVGQSGVMTALAAILGQVAIAVQGLTGAFDLLGRIIGITLGAIATFDFSSPIQSLKNWKAAVQEAGIEIQGKMDKAAASTEGAATAQSKLATQAGQTAVAAETSAASWLTVVNAYSKVSLAAENATAQAIKSAAARQEEGKATLSLAALLGTETDKRTAGLAVATQSAEALQTLANARQHEASVAAAQAESLAAVAKAEGVVSEQKRKSIQEANDKATALQAEADKAAAAALGAKQHAAALQTESAALADNSSRLGELKSAAEQAAAAVEQLKAARAAGTATAAQVSDAEIKSAQAAALYRDALNDQTAAIQRNATEKQSKLSLDQAGVRLDIERQRTIYEVAKAQGNEYGATQALLEIKRLEIKLAELTAQAKRAEADAALLVAQAKREELQASGQLTAAKEAELKAQEAGARVKQIEAQIAGETASRMRELADSYRLTGDAAQSASGGISAVGSAAENSIPAVDALTSSLENLNGAERAAADARAGRTSKMDSTSILDDKDVRGRVAPVDVEAMMYKRNPTATVDEVKAAAKYYGELYARGAATRLTGNLGNADNAAKRTNQVANQAMDQALELARRELATGQAIDLGTSVSDLTKKNIATTNSKIQVSPFAGEAALAKAYKSAGNEASAQTTKALTTVNINLNGQRNQLTMDEQSASSLAGIFKKLESDAARSF